MKKLGALPSPRDQNYKYGDFRRTPKMTQKSPFPELVDIVFPMSEKDFTGHYLRKEFCHISGERARFASLLPWSALNRILHEHRLDYPRLRLIRNGETLPPLSYIEYKTDRRGARFGRVRPDGLMRELNNGAMLHFAAIDEAHQPIELMAASLAGRLKSPSTFALESRTRAASPHTGTATMSW